jgi:hypothetical protein
MPLGGSGEAGPAAREEERSLPGIRLDRAIRVCTVDIEMAATSWRSRFPARRCPLQSGRSAR